MTQNYQITTSDEIGKGGAKTKARANLEAIRLLKSLETDQRTATSEEQAVLVKFSGWGTVADIFTGKPEWASLQQEMKSLLSDSEYESARAAILNAHYTAPEVAIAIYEGLERLGFNGGKILDPSMGATGLFEGTLPDEWGDRSEFVGVELDSLSGRIAQQLYPDASIHIRGFEDTALPDDQFDLAITNVPFSEIGVADPEYKGLPINTLHDYFFVKSLDKVRPGGLVAFITSSGTMQANSGQGVRELLAERANLVGAMRLPSSAFKQVAGTEVTTDLIILQKLGDGVEPNEVTWNLLQPSSVVGIEGNALPINEYYARNPHMMLGTLADDKLYPGRLALNGDGRDIQNAIGEAFNSLPEGIYRPASEQAKLQGSSILIPPELQDSVKPYGYVMHEDQLRQRVGYYLEPVELEGKKLERLQGMLAIRDAVQSVFQVQLQNGSEEELREAQTTLNQTYNSFVKSSGYINQTANKLVFRNDPDYPLLLALENYDAETKTATKTAIFSDRVIQAHQEKTEANNPKEALLYSLNERGRVDLEYIAQLVKQSESEVTSHLQQEKLIFLDPKKNQWVPEDEYLSGDVKAKLKMSQEAATEDSRYAINVEALQEVQPAPIPPGDIEVRLGAAWVPPSDVQDFVGHLLEAPTGVNIRYSSFLDAWSVDADGRVSGSVKNTKVYGTDRVGALRLIELGLNLKDPVVYDKEDDRLVVNRDDTAAARMKLEEIKIAFKDWVWQDPERTDRLTQLYNDKFNTFRPRQYNGTHLELPGSNPAIQLRPHQKDATWRVLQEGNSLLAHCVGSGKTFTTIAATMEQKRLGIVNKPMIVVPNHLLEQWAGDFKRLYPNSNVLAATKDDSSAQNRQELMSRIATGNWDAVIVTHSAFGKLKMSHEAQLDFYRAELDQVEEAAAEAKGNSSSRSMVKELERQKKRLEKRVDEVSNSRKDNAVTFEQLGVDQLYVDEAHYFKNLGYHTKMYGIAGLPNTTSDRAFDLFMKCRYLGQQQGEGKGVVFATGTPVSNSMAELYTMQRYLQPQALRQIGLEKFDAWASTFGETVTAPEINPAGGYKIKTRFSRFVNIPELMNTFRQTADIQTAEMLDLPTPELKGGKPQVVAVPASDTQLAFVEELAERAENLRNADPRDDNMLLITTDGRKASLDMRLVNPAIPHEHNKVDRLIEDAHEFWEQTQGDRTTHLIFCDLGTPKEDADSKNTKEIDVQKRFTVYRYIKDGLIERGVPANEIAFAQEFKTDVQKLEMQQKFNAGKIRILISGPQLETGFNGQKKLGLESHLTVPWRPDQVEQRDGRILRQGNENPEVEIRRYVTQGRDGRPSFDSYMWQTLETKKKFISQVMSGNSEVRTMEDVAGAALTYAEVKAIATGNPLIMEKAEVDNRVSQLAAQKRSHLNQQYGITQELRYIPERIDTLVLQIAALKADAQRVPIPESLTVVVQGAEFTDVKEAMRPIKARALEKQAATDFRPEHIGQVGEFDLLLKRERWGDGMNLIIQGQQEYECEIEHTYVGTASNLITALSNIEPRIQQTELRLEDAHRKLADLSQINNGAFAKEPELQAALKRQQEINYELGLNKDNAQAAVDDTEKLEESQSQSQSEAEVSIDRESSSDVTSIGVEEEVEVSKRIVNRSESQPEAIALSQSSKNLPTATNSEPGLPTARCYADTARVALSLEQEGHSEKRVARLLQESGLSEAIMQGEDFHLRADNEPFIPLVIERHDDLLYLTHYLSQNGDTFIDCEMVFGILEGGQIELRETAVQDPLRGGEDRGDDRAFARAFSQNLLDQGFVTAMQNAWAQQSQLSESEAVDPLPQLSEPAVSPEPQQTPQRTIAQSEEHDTWAAEIVSEMLHESGVIPELLKGDRFQLEIKNYPYPPLFLARDGERLSLSQYTGQDVERTLDQNVEFTIEATGKLTLLEEEVFSTNINKDAQEMCADWSNQGYANGIKKTWEAEQQIEQFSLLDADQQPVVEEVETPSARSSRYPQGVAALIPSDPGQVETQAQVQKVVEITSPVPSSRHPQEVVPTSSSDQAQTAEPTTLQPFQSTKIQSTKSSVEVETTEVQAIQSALDPSDPETKNVGLREIREDKVPPPQVPPMIKALTAEHQIGSEQSPPEQSPAAIAPMAQALATERHSPTLEEMRNWRLDATLLGRNYEKRIKQLGNEMLQGEQSQLPKEQRDPAFQNPDFTLPDKAYQAMKLDSSESEQMRTPTRGDLILWFQAAKLSGQDEAVTDSIKDLGQQMIQGTEQEELAPKDRDTHFKNPNFVLTRQDFIAMKEAIASLQNSLEEENPKSKRSQLSI